MMVTKVIKRSGEPSPIYLLCRPRYVLSYDDLKNIGTVETEKSNEEVAFFDMKNFLSILKSDLFGRRIIYQQVTNSTMSLIESFPSLPGLVAIASEQVEGRGRSTNIWSSPRGQAIFSLKCVAESTSGIAKKMTLIQHVASIACAKSILNMPGYEKVNIKLKWPNDLYWGNETKIGGILVLSKDLNREIQFNIGIGFNVNNEKPTDSINGLMSKDERFKHLKPIKIEEFIANTLNELHIRLRSLENNEIDSIEREYLSLWMHDGEKVKVGKDEKLAIVKGIDEYGFLKAQDDETGEMMSIHPDENRYDIFQRMIYSRR